MRVDVRFHESPCTTELLTRILERLDAMAADLARLETEVAETATVIDSAIVLLTGIRAELEAAKTDPARVQALIDALDAKTNALAAALVDGTVAEGETPAGPPVG